MERHILPEYQRRQAKGKGFLYKEDGDSSHSAKVVKAWKTQKLGLQDEAWYYNSPYSPDFSIIENVWRILKQRLKRRAHASMEQIKEAMQDVWAKISQKEINKLVATMPTRMEEAVKLEGKHTAF